ncbi:YHS domain-containing (seleno)protein [Tenacibaculum agarivorans]|uniref:YHS domain-containing (seleno)protein n=1 Tax=Tenacibaculum agarivorans TaxID=1908389 RepID=UPI00094BA297|nr:YHS domain-containing (seleno)protein [Tenacibaculum agarivorans]
MKNSILSLFAIATIIIFSQCSKTDDKKAVGGYDVVSYFNEGPVKGSESFSTEYNGKTFFFASKESLKKFSENPEQYVPQYGGYCAYAIAKKKIKMGVDPEIYEIRDGKLYLFYNSFFANKLNDWKNEDTKALQKQGDINWEEIKNNKD